MSITEKKQKFKEDLYEAVRLYKRRQQLMEMNLHDESNLAVVQDEIKRIDECALRIKRRSNIRINFIEGSNVIYTK